MRWTRSNGIHWSFVDEAKIEHEIGKAWDKRSHSEETVQIAAKSGYRDGPASLAFQVIANTQKQCRFRVRAHSHPVFTHMSGVCTKELYQLSSPIEVQQGPPFDSSWHSPASMSDIHQSTKALLGLCHPHFWIKTPCPKELTSPRSVWGWGAWHLVKGSGNQQKPHILIETEHIYFDIPLSRYVWM